MDVWIERCVMIKNRKKSSFSLSLDIYHPEMMELPDDSGNCEDDSLPGMRNWLRLEN